MTRHRPSTERARAFAPALLLTLVGGIGATVPVHAVPDALPRVAALAAPAAASSAPASPSTAAQAGTVQLSTTPPNQTQAVPPNVVVTFDDSGSMAWDYMGDKTPFKNSAWKKGPWYCAGVIDPTASKGINAHVMNGVYYNPKVTYTPPAKADGGVFPDADASLATVWNDGITWNRPLDANQYDGTTDFTNQTDDDGDTTYWQCPYDSSNGDATTNRSGGSGGPYYYVYNGPAITTNKYGEPDASGLDNLYTKGNWKAVPVPKSQYQNWANWWAYYHTRNLMARTSVSRVFGSSNLGSKINDPGMWDDGGFGTTIRVAWQNINVGTYKLPDTAIISSLIDTSACTAAASTSADPKGTQRSGTIKTPPSCYRSAFFNWIYQVPANNGTPLRSATARAGTFFTRGTNNTGASGNLADPYWEPPKTGSGDGHELACRQNYQLLVTDGLWNGDQDGPLSADLSLPAATTKLPDGVQLPDPATAGVTAIYKPVHDGGDDGYASLSDVAFHYWATNLRTDLYKPAAGDIVSPYLPDQSTSVFKLTGSTGSSVKSTDINPEIYFNPKNDPATWPHMADYMVGLGVSGQLNFSDDTDCSGGIGSNTTDACLLRQGLANSSGAIGWPTPNGNGNGITANIDDTWHAALAGRGQFFSAGNPQQLVDQLSKILTNISARNVPPATTALNTSVLVPGALAFTTGYNAADWSGTLQAVQANADGSVGSTALWDASTDLTDASITDPAKRNILSAKLKDDGSFDGGIDFKSDSSFDAAAQAALMLPAPTDTTNDTLANRVDYLRGVRTEETKDVLRKRDKLLGAIIDSHAIYVAYPASGYLDNWPASSPEATAAASGHTGDDGSYEQFVQNHISRAPVVYVGANDGMLHAFDASVTKDTSTTPAKIVPTATAGKEVFAYVPRAVYGNLGNLTSTSYNFLPTVDGTPVTRDVYFDADSDASAPTSTKAGWHTMLVGNLRNGGRGVYALDVTDPTAMTAAGSVLWEFSAATPKPTSGCVASYGDCDPADLGFTYGQPNIGRLANGKWVVLVPGGYFPDCSKVSYNAGNCPTPGGAPTAGTPAVAFSSLFVLDAQTGSLLAELKTPTKLAGVTSYGLSSPVLGDYDNNQVDDIAFAGDLAGNLWRYDLSNKDSSKWTVSLAFKPTTQGAQPITSMPRLFPDPATNRFIVVFGTGKYLGANDNSSAGPSQAIYGIRDELDSSGNTGGTVDGITKLAAQTLAEADITNADGTVNTVRGATDNPVAASQDGWYIPLKLTTSPGERVVVTPGALFDTNRVIVTSLIPASNDPCTATITGATMVFNAATGGSAGGLSEPANPAWTGKSTFRVVGAKVNNPPTSGTVPVATVVGGGSLLTPGLPLAGGGTLKIDDAVWRRRSWGVLDNDR